MPALAGPPGHLARRFVSFLSARGLDAPEQRWVAEVLRPEERQAFWSQPIADQRHAHDCARLVADGGAGATIVRAALLHDIGKRRARLGAVGRAVATVLAALGIHWPGAVRRYTRHGPIGAAELAAAGAESLVVDFTAEHHGDRPATIDPADWALLKAADQAT